MGGEIEGAMRDRRIKNAKVVRARIICKPGRKVDISEFD